MALLGTKAPPTLCMLPHLHVAGRAGSDGYTMTATAVQQFCTWQQPLALECQLAGSGGHQRLPRLAEVARMCLNSTFRQWHGLAWGTLLGTFLMCSPGSLYSLHLLVCVDYVILVLRRPLNSGGDSSLSK